MLRSPGTEIQFPYWIFKYNAQTVVHAPYTPGTEIHSQTTKI